MYIYMNMIRLSIHVFLYLSVNFYLPWGAPGPLRPPCTNQKYFSLFLQILEV